MTGRTLTTVAIAARIPMIATTIINSIKVKPF